MHLSTPTLDVLKNFSVIQNSIVLREGNVIYTISEARTIVGRAVISETFDRDVPILNGLSQFLNTLKLFNGDPDIVLEDNLMRVTLGKQGQLFRYSDETFIVRPKVDPIENDVRFKYDFTFDITDEDLTRMKKAASINSLPNFVIRGKDGKVSVVACDASGKNGSSDNEFSLDVDVPTDAEFQVVIKIGNILVLNRDYRVNVAISSEEARITKWESINDGEDVVPVNYWVVVESELSYHRSI